MSNLENLTSKIEKDGEEKARLVIEKANQQADENMQQTIQSAEIDKKKILSDGEAEAKRTYEQILLSKKLEQRDQNLKAKQQMIDKVFEVALKELNDMSADDYWKFLSDSLKNIDTDGEELILPSKYKVENLDELNSFLSSNGKKGNLKLYKGKRDVTGGFILVKGGIENNATFESLIQHYRHDLESDVISSIF